MEYYEKLIIFIYIYEENNLKLLLNVRKGLGRGGGLKPLADMFAKNIRVLGEGPPNIVFVPI